MLVLPLKNTPSKNLRQRPEVLFESNISKFFRFAKNLHNARVFEDAVFDLCSRASDLLIRSNCARKHGLEAGLVVVGFTETILGLFEDLHGADMEEREDMVQQAVVVDQLQSLAMRGPVTLICLGENSSQSLVLYVQHTAPH